MFLQLLDSITLLSSLRRVFKRILVMWILWFASAFCCGVGGFDLVLDVFCFHLIGFAVLWCGWTLHI